jgi:hypothetical protein
MFRAAARIFEMSELESAKARRGYSGREAARVACARVRE